MVAELCLSREENTPWGFRLVGGVEFEVPLTVIKVKPGSVAHKAGLCDGDIITRIDSIPAHQLSHSEAQYVINEAHDQIHLTVVRGRSNAALLQKYITLEPEYEYDYVPAYEAHQDYDQTDEVSDAELRAITASPFPASEEKHYRPFSTEPIEGIPPIEDPIILSPYYKDDFSTVKKGEIEPETKFKLPKSPAALMFESSTGNQNNLTDNLYIDYDEYMTKAYQQYFAQYTNGTETPNTHAESYSTNALESERLNVYEQIQALNQNYRGENEAQINSENVNQTVPLNLEYTKETMAKNVAKEILQENLPKLTENIQNEFVMEYNEKVEIKTEHQEINQTPDPLITYVATVEHSERVTKTPTIIEQSEIIVQETNVINESTEITKTESVRNSPIVVEPIKTEQKTAEITKEIKQETLKSKSEEIKKEEQRNKKKQIDNFIDQSQIKEKLTESIAKHVNEKQSTDSSETSTKTTKSVKEVREEAVSIANLLTEQARTTWLRSQTIPSLQYSVQSTYHHDLLLKTFFIHLTDVMVALSRLIMTEAPNSRPSSPMPPGQAAQSSKQALEKILAQKATQTEQISASKTEELVDAKVAKIAEVVSKVGTAEILAKKSEATLKIESLLGQKDPLDWLAEKDEEITQTSVTSTVANEVSENQSESLVKEEVLSNSEVVVQEETKIAVQEDIKEETKVDIQKEVKEETKVVVQEDIKEQIKVDIQEEVREQTKEVIQEDIKEKLKVDIQEEVREQTKVVVQEDIKEQLKVDIQEEVKEQTKVVVQEDIKEQLKVDIHEELKEQKKVVVQEDIKEQLKVDIQNELKEETKVVVQEDIKDQIKVDIQEEVKEETKATAQEDIKEEINIVVQEEIKNEPKVDIREDTTVDLNIVIKEDKKEETKLVNQEDINEELHIVIREDINKEMNVVVEEDIKEEINVVVQEEIKGETNVAAEEEIKEEVKVIVQKELEVVEEATHPQEEVKLEKTEDIKITQAKLVSKEVSNIETIISGEVLNTETDAAESTHIVTESSEKSVAETVEDVIISEISASNTDRNVSENLSDSQIAVKDESMTAKKKVAEEFQSSESRRESIEVTREAYKKTRGDLKLKSILKKTQTSENVETQEERSPQLEPDENANLATPVEVAPPTPLTDEYIFRLDVYVPGLKRSTSKSPEPNPEPQALHEDPHIVKKPRLKASIETKIESVIYKPDGDTNDDSTVDCRSVERELVQEMLAKESTTEQSERTSRTAKSTTEQLTASQKSANVTSQIQNGHTETENIEWRSESVQNSGVQNGAIQNGVGAINDAFLTGSVQNGVNGRSESVLNGTIENVVDIMVHNVTEEEVGKPGLSEETIAEVISGEAEMLKEAHVIGLQRVLTSHMTRVSEEEGDENSSFNSKKIQPQIGTLKDSEVVKALNEDILQTEEEKKKEERRWTTFLQKPNRPVPRTGQSTWGQAYDELQGDYKVKIVKQPKPKIAPDAPKDYNTGPLPWEERQANEPPPEPIQQEEPILVPEEGPEYLEAVDPLPESAVPDLEDTGLPLPPEPVAKEVAEPTGVEEAETEEEVEVIREEDEVKEGAEDEEMAQNRLAEEVLNNFQNMVDGELSVEQQLAQVQAQLLALAQIPAAIQQTLEAVTKQLSKIVPQRNGQKQAPVLSDTEHSEGHITEDEGQTTDAESLVAEEVHQTEQQAQNGYDQLQNGEAAENGIPDIVLEPVVEVEVQPNSEELKTVRQQEVVILDEQSRTEKQKKELISELELEHSQRQVKQRPTGRVGRPKPVFGPLTPQERPLVLPGGRRWRGPKDAYNEQFIAETLAAQAEVIKGKAVGINFMKYGKPPVSLDHLKESSVYKMVHDMDEEPLRAVEYRPPLVLAESEFREKCRSVTPNLDGPKL